MKYHVEKLSSGEYRAQVSWIASGVRKRKYFKTIASAEGWAQIRNAELKRFGVGTAAVPEEIRVQAMDAIKMVEPYGRSLMDAVKLACSIWEAENASIAAEDAVSRLIAHREQRGMSGARGGSDRYVQDLRLRLAPFAEAFSGRKLSSINRREVSDWIEGLSGGAVNKNNTLRLLSVLWEFSRRNEWVKENTARLVERREAPDSRIEVLSPAEAARLLHSAPERFKAHLAIWLFCGPRRTELERINRDSVDLQAGLVRIDVTKTKGAARRYVKIRPALKAWLDDRKPKRLTPAQIRDDLSSAVLGAEIDRWPNNACRHSFCSYALAGERDLNDLVLEMGHTNPHTLFAHYRELVKPEQAAAYWSLTPERVSELAASGF